MESNTYEDSKSSSEETDRSEQASDEMGTGRSYECVFCKRGFTTAQALGGHMNIHRKDRAKNRPITLVPPISDKVDRESNYGGFRSYMQVQSYPTHYAMPPEVQGNYQTFFPESTWSDRSMHSTTYHGGDNSYGKNPMYLNPFGDDWRSGNLSLRVDQSDHVPDDDDDEDKEKRGGDGEDDDELDLELRLGHDP
ncbi:hypothetical protein QYF36_010269 [Acer negundo]|nr:hypothetical protein QYF36_010269 [Acer negundo]